VPASRHPDRRPVLPGRCARRERRLLEFRLSRRADGHRPQQLLLHFGSGLHGRRRRACLLRGAARQREMPADADAARLHAERRQSEVLSQRLCAGGRRLLPRRQSDVDRRLLPSRTNAKRPQQHRMQADLPYSDRVALLRLWPHSDRQRRLLRARERNHDRRLLRRADRPVQSRRLPGSNPGRQGLRGRLLEDAGRFLLQYPQPQPRRTHVPDRLEAVRPERSAGPLGRLRAHPGLSARRGAHECRRLRRDTGSGLSVRGGSNPRGRLRAGAARRLSARLCALPSGPLHPDPAASLSAGPSVDPRRRLRADPCAGVSAWRDAFARRRLRADRPAGMSPGGGADHGRRLRAGRAAGMSPRSYPQRARRLRAPAARSLPARSHPQYPRRLRAGAARALPARIPTQSSRRLRTGAASALSAAKHPEPLRRLRSVRGAWPVCAERAGRICAAARTVRAGRRRGLCAAPMIVFIMEVTR